MDHIDVLEGSSNDAVTFLLGSDEFSIVVGKRSSVGSVSSVGIETVVTSLLQLVMEAAVGSSIVMEKDSQQCEQPLNRCKSSSATRES